MQATQTQFDMRAIQSSWSKLDSMVHLRPIYDEAGYEQMTSLMNSLLDVVGNNEDHALSGLLELVGDLVSKFERASYAIEAAAPVDSLRFLIEARGLKQEALCSIVPQSNLSAILAGKREISATLAGKLGKFFDISPAIFVPKQPPDKRGERDALIAATALVHGMTVVTRNVADFKPTGVTLINPWEVSE